MAKDKDKKPTKGKSVKDRLQAVEDRLAIAQLICGYGYAVDGCNAEAVGSFYAEDGVYAVAGSSTWEGREAVAGITASPGHLSLVTAGCAHISTNPYIVLDGDRAGKEDVRRTVVRLLGRGYECPDSAAEARALRCHQAPPSVEALSRRINSTAASRYAMAPADCPS